MNATQKDALVGQRFAEIYGHGDPFGCPLDDKLTVESGWKYRAYKRFESYSHFFDELDLVDNSKSKDTLGRIHKFNPMVEQLQDILTSSLKSLQSDKSSANVEEVLLNVLNSTSLLLERRAKVPPLMIKTDWIRHILGGVFERTGRLLGRDTAIQSVHNAEIVPLSTYRNWDTMELLDAHEASEQQKLEREIAELVERQRPPLNESGVPLYYKDRIDRKENAISFLMRIYGGYLVKGREVLYQDFLRKIDSDLAISLDGTARQKNIKVVELVPTKSTRIFRATESGS